MPTKLNSYKAVEDLTIIIESLIEVKSIISKIEDTIDIDHGKLTDDLVTSYQLSSLELFTQEQLWIIHVGLMMSLNKMIDQKNRAIDDANIPEDDKENLSRYYSNKIFKIQDFLEFYDSHFHFKTQSHDCVRTTTTNK